MNRYVKNFPAEVKIDALQKHVCLSFPGRRDGEAIPIMEYRRVEALLTGFDADVSKDILTTYALLQSHLERFRKWTSPDGLDEIRQYKARLCRIRAMLRNTEQFRLKFIYNRLSEVEVVGHLDTTSHARRFVIPRPVWEDWCDEWQERGGFSRWYIPRAAGMCVGRARPEVPDTFIVEIDRESGLFQGLLRACRGWFSRSENAAYLGMRLSDEAARNGAFIAFREKLNALYFILKDTGTADAAGLALDIIGITDEVERAKFRDILGRGQKSQIELSTGF